MLGMIKKDLLMVKGNSKTIVACFLIYIFYSFMFNMNMSFVFPFMALIICLSTFSYDDFNNWHLYAISLPGSRSTIVKAKYITTIFLILIATIFGVLLSTIIGSLSNVFNFNEVFEFTLGILFAIFFIMSLLFPFLFKYGAEKGRMATMITGVSIMGIYLLLTKVIHIKIPTNFISILDSYFPIIFIVGTTLIIFISYMFSKNYYFKREF